MKRTTRPLKKKRCKAEGCGEEFVPFTSTQIVCSIPCAQKIVKERKQAEYKAETRRLKKEHLANDRAYQLKLAQAAFNAYIRERDKDQPCISCGTTDPNLKYDAGHYRTLGAAPELRFNEYNCHKQCAANCNQHKSGNIVEYRIRLVHRIGRAKVEWLEKNHPPMNYTLEDIVAIKERYTEKARKLKSDQDPYIIV